MQRDRERLDEQMEEDWRQCDKIWQKKWLKNEKKGGKECKKGEIES